MKIDFKGKTAIVTGAMRGIGKKIAEDLYSCGATVMLTGRDSAGVDKLNRLLKGNRRIRYHHLDLLNKLSVDKFLETIRDVRKIDILVNNAGINRIDHIYDVDEGDWDDIMSVNMRGPFILSKEVGSAMKKRRYGRIVNIASIFGVITREKRSAYTASKSGLIGLTRTIAADLAPYNILVNSVSPGFVLTDLTKNILSEKERRSLVSQIPLGRFAQPKDVSTAVLFLASEMNSYITGQNIIVDGGYVNE